MAEEEAYGRFLGRSLATMTQVLNEEFGFRVGPDFLEDMRHDLYSLFKQELQPICGIEETLDRLRTPRCVASSSNPDRIRLSLTVTGLIERLEPNLFSATMVKNGKPAPDLFLHAAASMGVHPSDCIVVEDSPAGIEAAQRAGMTVFARHRDRKRNCMRDHLVAVDVGTGSARAGIFDRDGRMLAKAKHPIRMFRPKENHAEHDSEDIWVATCTAVKAVLGETGLAADRIAAIGFDATCSLVARDREGRPLTVSTTGKANQDTVVWLDHRAIEQAERLSASAHAVLQFSGGSLSPEMQIPKLMWLKENLPTSWEGAGFFFDLADFLTWKATGRPVRSRCTLTAKWNYLSHQKPGWSSDYLALAGLDDLLEKAALPPDTMPSGASLGPLAPAAAAELGLDTAVLVAPGLIDAYAGALGALGGAASDGGLERSVALIGGTSSCIVAFARDPKPGRSLWGPYFEAVLPDYWLVEGGQSAAGALLDHLVSMHASGGEPSADLHGRIIARIGELRAEAVGDIAPHLHILPDFHGNRSPLADPHATGVVSGLTLDTSFDGLCRIYWRSCVAIALGIRHILDAMQDYGYLFETLHVAGGHVHNPLLVELYADVTGRKVKLPATLDAVLLGTAMTAAVAGGLHGSLFCAGSAMDAGGSERLPDPERTAAYDRDYRRFLAMIRHREELKAL
eukprot:g9915.t1